MNLALFTGQPGIGEVLIILAVILLLFGARRLPELSRSLGRSLSEFKRGRQEGLEDELKHTKSENDTEA
jgi:sec-independent protein translocase protein TatA